MTCEHVWVLARSKQYQWTEEKEEPYITMVLKRETTSTVYMQILGRIDEYYCSACRQVQVDRLVANSGDNPEFWSEVLGCGISNRPPQVLADLYRYVTEEEIS